MKLLIAIFILTLCQANDVPNRNDDDDYYVPTEPLKHASTLIKSQEHAVEVLEKVEHAPPQLLLSKEDVNIYKSIAQPTDPEIFMNVKQLITYRGYPCEEHNVQTDDGFILTMQRIPNPVNRDKLNVVYLQHGLLCSAADFVMDPSNRSLAFILHEAGYDVWLGNMRGNIYSRQHVTYHPTDDSFWDWSWEEMAKYDLPAIVNKILSVTQRPQLYYVGHSQGTLIGFSGFSENQNLASKIKTFFALAPVAFLGQVKSPLRLVAPMSDNIGLLLDMLGLSEFLPNTAMTKWFSAAVCGVDSLKVACSNSMFMLVGFNAENLDTNRVAIYAAHDPAGTSSKNFIHFAQLISSNRLQRYDYGFIKNLIKYQQRQPPEYNLDNFIVPTILFWGQEDWLAAPDGVKKLIPKIKSLKGSINYDKYNHIDFLWGLDAPDKVYKKIISYMKN